jgi:hypothetical protein
MRPKSTLDAGRADIRMRLENLSRLCVARGGLLRCDLKTKLNFSCCAKRTVVATTVVDFAPHGVDLR